MNNRVAFIMAAGTGGHIIPGIALGKELEQRGWKIIWVGTRNGMENKLVPGQGFLLERLNFHGIRGKGLFGSIKGVLQLLLAFLHSAMLIFKHRPDVIVGMGGYVCLPGGIMAGLMRRPLIMVNADASLLLSNKTLLPFTDTLICGFDGSAAKLDKALVLGNPVRAEIEAITPPEQRFATRSGPLRILVVGGSLGAKALNELLPAALGLIAPEQRPVIVHQTGEKNYQEVYDNYKKQGFEFGTQLEVCAFIDNMAERLEACDVIICRAGAITVSELCAAGIASVLVPLVVTTTSHQKDNAIWMEQMGAGRYCDQKTLTAESLAQLMTDLKRSDLLAMALKAKTLAPKDAAQKAADLCDHLSKN